MRVLPVHSGRHSALLVTSHLSLVAAAMLACICRTAAAAPESHRAFVDDRRTLHVEGTDASEVIVIEVGRGAVEVSHGHATGEAAAQEAEFALDAFDRLALDAAGGDDFVNIIDPSGILDGQRKALALDGGDGENIVVLSHAPFDRESARQLLALLALGHRVEALAARAGEATVAVLREDVLGHVGRMRTEVAEVSQSLAKRADERLAGAARDLSDRSGAELLRQSEAFAVRLNDLGKRHDALVTDLTRTHDPTNGVYPEDDSTEPPDPAEPDAGATAEEPKEPENGRAQSLALSEEAIGLGVEFQESMAGAGAAIETEAMGIKTRLDELESQAQALLSASNELGAQAEAGLEAAADAVFALVSAELAVLGRSIEDATKRLQAEVSRDGRDGSPPAAKVGGPAPSPQRAACDPIVARHTYAGGSDTDVFIAFASTSPGSSWAIAGNAGADILIGGLADDRIDGGAGGDWIFGLKGDDLIHGDADGDFLFGEFLWDVPDWTGNDCIHGGAGIDFACGDNFTGSGSGTPGGKDSLYGDADADLLFGDDATDVLTPSHAGGDDPVMEGGDGRDLMFGCGGKDTMHGNDGIDFVSGNGGDDTIHGEPGESVQVANVNIDLGNLLLGNLGADTLHGDIGIDLIFGNDGDDPLLIGDGQVDLMFGGMGVDLLKGEAGGKIAEINGYPIRLGNIMFGGDQDDTMWGGGDLDLMWGGAGDDAIRGFNGTFVAFGIDGDWLVGGPGDDMLKGDAEEPGHTNSLDWIFGEAGADTLDGGSQPDYMFGDEGPDTMDGDSNSIALVHSADFMFGGPGEDDMDGGNALDIMAGGADDDRMQGDDERLGLASPDLMFGGPGSDTMNGGSTVDIMLGEDGADRMLGDTNNLLSLLNHDWLFGQDGADGMDGGNGVDALFGGQDGDAMQGDDSTFGLVSPDFVSGDAGGDVMDGGVGSDLTWGGPGDDRMIGDNGAWWMLLSTDVMLGNDGCDTMLGGRAVDVMSGGADSDAMSGEHGPDIMSGDGGHDRMDGGGWPDIMTGGDSNDILHGNGSLDLVFGQDGDDCLYGDDGPDSLSGGAGRDCLRGGGHPDLLVGGDDDDLLFGDGGADLLFGGGGDDVLDGGNGLDTLSGGSGSDTGWGGNSSPFNWFFSIENKHGKGASGLDCACQPCLGNLCVRAFEDLNGNGVQDGGEAGLGNWVFHATGPSSQVLTTDASGNACANGIPCGTYSIVETTQNGWTPTTAATQSASVPSCDSAHVSFGNLRAGRICIRKFNDINGNGTHEPTESGLLGWSFTVTSPNGTQQVHVTDATGVVCFAAPAGTYTIVEASKPSWIATTPTTRTVTARSTTVDVEFGNKRKVEESGELCIRKFNDLNGDGTRQASEPWLANWVFTVTGPVTFTLTTDAQGRACRSRVPCGAYTVVETAQPPPWTPTTSATQVAVVMPDQSAEVTFGNWRKPLAPGRLCVRKFNDLNGDGTRQGTEPWLASWAFSATGPVSVTLTTDASGLACADVPAGSYTIVESMQSGWTATTQATQTAAVTSGQATDVTFGNRRKEPVEGRLCIRKFNDVDGDGVQDTGETGLIGWQFTVTLPSGIQQSVVTDVNGLACIKAPPGSCDVVESPKSGWTATTPTTQAVIVPAGQTEDVTFGNRRGGAAGATADLCVHKFEDADGDGVQDAGETGLQGWQFTVTLPDGSQQSVVTGIKGKICLKTPAGACTVVETTKAGWSATTPTTQTANAVAGQTANITFGNRRSGPAARPGELCVRKFEDANRNGVQDAGEPSLSGWHFTVTMPDGTQQQLVTDGKGSACMRVPAGSCTVVETLQAGWIATTATTQSVAVQPLQTTAVEFGNRRAGSGPGPGDGPGPGPGGGSGELCVHEFSDGNGNGVKDAGEMGLAGWSFRVEDATGAVVMTIVTGTQGSACRGLPPGSYTVVEVPKPGWTATTSATQPVTLVPARTTDIMFGHRRR